MTTAKTGGGNQRKAKKGRERGRQVKRKKERETMKKKTKKKKLENAVRIIKMTPSNSLCFSFIFHYSL